MPKAPPALLVALLLLVAALAAPASVGGASLLQTQSATTTPSLGVSENTTRVLRLDQIQASGFGEPRVVVLDAATAQAAVLDTEYSLAVVSERLAAAPNATVRREVLANYTAAAATDVAALKRDERAARQAYITGEITTEAYAQRLAVLHARAEALQRFLGSTSTPTPSMWSYTSTYPGLQDRVDYLREDIQYLTGPVRAEMAAAVRGERTPVRVFVAAGEQGFELSSITVEDVYVRSAYRADNLDDDPGGARSIESIIRIAPMLYPWAVGENITGPGNLAATPIAAYGTIRTSIQHPHGRVLAFVDDTTEQVYYEVQYKRLEALPADHAVDRTTNGTRVLVTETYPGGPLGVRLLDVSGEEPEPYVGVPVTLNDTITHRTGVNGVAWFVSPRGEYNVTAAVNGTAVRVNVTA